MDCLDEPLHLEILSSLAANLAVKAGDSDVDDSHIGILLEGLPNIHNSPEQEQCDEDHDDDEEEWDEFETNHAISFAHYVASLPSTSPYLPTAFPRLRKLLTSIIARGAPSRALETLAVPASSGSGSGTASLQNLTTIPYANLLEALFKAILWVGWCDKSFAAEAGTTIAEALEHANSAIGPAITFATIILATVHSVVSHVPLPQFPPGVTARILSAVVAIGSPDNLITAVGETSTPRRRFNTAPHPTNPAGVALLVTEISNILLARVLTPLPEVNQAAFTADSNLTEPIPSTVWRNQTTSLLADPVIPSALHELEDGQVAIEVAFTLALRWWNDLNNPDPTRGSAFGLSAFNRRSTVVSFKDSQNDDEVYLTIAVLHLLNLLSLHKADADGEQLTRLKLLLSENSSVSDARVLQSAFVCTAILVRNYPSLGSSLTHHIRRLLMCPLPALEHEMTSTGSQFSPTISAASTCLAICIEMSANDDLISSTLYSLLGVLSHGSTIAPGAQSIRSAHYSMNGNTNGGLLNPVYDASKPHVSKARTADQRRIVSTTAVEIVSRLALDTGREDIIHLSISMLLQRLRGLDIETVSSIVTNLVPLALAAADDDLVEVYRAFSHLSRSSHPEDPKMSFNSVLAAQTTLARDLGSRLDQAEGYMFELLTLFADKGTQTQLLMVGGGAHKREKETLRESNAKRADDLTAELSALLLPISALLSHDDFHPDVEPSSDCVAAFRNLWVICASLGLSGQTSQSKLSEHELNALSIIAGKSPALVLEKSRDFVGSELEYNTVLRKDFGQSIHKQMQHKLTRILPSQKAEVRNMTTPQLTLLVAINDLEEMRTLRYRPSVFLNYFSNESIIKNVPLSTCLTAMARKLSSVFLRQCSRQVVEHKLPSTVSEEVRQMLVLCTHRMRKVREEALKYVRQIIETFSALMCDRNVVFTLLEILTLMRRSCELQFTDEYSPVHEFRSNKIPLKLVLTEDYAARNDIVSQLHAVARQWLTLAISRAPIEVQSTLQAYLNESRDVLLIDSVEMGAGLALHFSKAISRLDRQETLMPVIGGWPSDSSNLFASQFASKNYYDGELSGARHVLVKGLSSMQADAPRESTLEVRQAFKSQMEDAMQKASTKLALSVVDLRRLLLRAVSVLIASPKLDVDILHYLVQLPIQSFTPLAIAAGVDAWTWLVRQRPEAEVPLIGEISAGWLSTIKAGKGLFSTSMNYKDPFVQDITYTPSDKKVMDIEMNKARRLLRPHLLLVQILSSQFQAVKYRAPGIMISLARLLLRSLAPTTKMSTHPLAREVRFTLLLFGFQVLASSRMETVLELRFRNALFNNAFSWFALRPQWSFGSDRIQIGAEIRLLEDFIRAVKEDQIRADHATSSMNDRAAAWLIAGSRSLEDYHAQHQDRVRLMELLVESEINRLAVWSNPSNDRTRTMSWATPVESSIGAEQWGSLIRKAWRHNPAVAVHMGERFKNPNTHDAIADLVRRYPKDVLTVPEALSYAISDRYGQVTDRNIDDVLLRLAIWDAVPPVEALDFFQPRFSSNPLLLQYAMRVLEQHPVGLVFFFVPQVVQAVRYDTTGYVERFIFETSKISQLFCHQIIWNMKANTYKDDLGEEPDPMKPTLDRMIDQIVESLNGKAKAFYDKEFTFFDEVTSISGKLKPYIKKTKPEKKAKIDEEMAKIKLEVGVYLPSNPDGVVIDLDRKSGRPLQSHAKAPFMATFKVQKERYDLSASDANNDAAEEMTMVKYDVWQSAIFKVGDDCRQDVLALQLIAMFKNVFTQLGLTLYLFPYRVTATAPGCGVIDVVPNATSRDEMGRAQINDLVEYFIDKYGGVDTVEFQKARLNFIQSMAAYSVACYILQIKDRHNGNIMIDGDGHIVHIDFGFLFDIGPGGIKFEAGSFKLNKEMVALMGGEGSQGYRMFVDLTVKAFLAIRPHVDQLVDTVNLMLGTGLPSFKGEGTIKRLRDRFAPSLNERAAADHMLGIIRNAHENVRSDIYDGFQKYQNGIPY